MNSFKEIKSTLQKAINEFKKVQFIYREGGDRIVNPYHYGLYGKEESLHAYQTDGYSKTSRTGMEKF